MFLLCEWHNCNSAQTCKKYIYILDPFRYNFFFYCFFFLSSHPALFHCTQHNLRAVTGSLYMQQCACVKQLRSSNTLGSQISFQVLFCLSLLISSHADWDKKLMWVRVHWTCMILVRFSCSLFDKNTHICFSSDSRNFTNWLVAPYYSACKFTQIQWVLFL